MRYRKKPVIIEAEQWNPAADPGEKTRGICTCGSQAPHVHTMHNNQLVLLAPGDWIIPEPDGVHFYPVKPDVFAATYELVKE